MTHEAGHGPDLPELVLRTGSLDGLLDSLAHRALALTSAGGRLRHHPQPGGPPPDGGQRR